MASHQRPQAERHLVGLAKRLARSRTGVTGQGASCGAGNGASSGGGGSPAGLEPSTAIRASSTP